jgi:putative copper export protein
VLSPTAATVRLTLHVLAATVWVGGQFTLAGLLPVLRRHEGLPKLAARAFNRIAWPAFAVLVLTGIWNLVEIDVTEQDTAYQVTVFVKIAVAIIAGAAAAAHATARSKLALALGGAVGALASVAAVFLGILLRTGS